MPVDQTDPNFVDAVSIGFGPAAIALACVFADAEEAGDALGKRRVRYFERAASTAWQPELLLDGTDINHHSFRDLVTPRNPRSRFSFAMYLKAKDRLFDFTLLGRPASRHEWSDYIAWVASQVNDGVSYEADVPELLPGIVGNRLDHVVIENGRERVTTRNLVISTGSSPRIPEVYMPHLGERVFHTHEFLSRLDAFGPNLPRRWLVIGSGHSASESVWELLARREDIEIQSMHRSIGFRLTQLGQFPNQVFSPRHVDYFHELGPQERTQYLKWSQVANYAGIDPDESSRLFSTIYEDKLKGRRRLEIRPHYEVVSVTKNDRGYVVEAKELFNGGIITLEVDAIVLATGFMQHIVPSLLSNLQPWLQIEEGAGLSMDRDYRIAMTEDSDVRLFANGLSERTHGIGDGQSFSLMALRAERIARGFAA